MPNAVKLKQLKFNYLGIMSDQNKPEDFSTITEREVIDWTSSHLGESCAVTYLLDILTGKYDLTAAREQLLSFREGNDA